MITSKSHNKIKTFGIPIGAAFLLASCGTYQQSSYYGDGIYSSDREVVRVEKRNADAVPAQEGQGNQYEEYFGQRADQIGEILDNEVFTDIDGYTSQDPNDSIPYGDQADYMAQNNTYLGNPGWGDNPTNLTINVYDNSWGYGGLYGFGWNYPYWGLGWNYPYYGWGWGWHNPWRYNRWGWAWGGYYSPWYGYGSWGYPRYYGYYGYWSRPNYYNNGRSYARMTGRRGYNNDYIGGTTLLRRTNETTRRAYNLDRDRTNSRGNALASRSSRSYSESQGNTARRAVNADAVDRNTDYRSSRSTRYNPGYSGSSRSSRTYGTTPSTRSSGSYNRSGTTTTRRSSPVYRNSGNRSSTRSYQSSGRTAPRSSSYSRPSSSSRSSGTIQSSGSSSRSSGASRSSGSSRSGRGGN